ncbi:MAG: polyprenyl synthetase family protein [Bacteroidaceae bacterium]|nr:polyprenyl synthetase family protein [Bacteroidaceae bacterium]
MDLKTAIQAPIKQELDVFKEYYNAQFSSEIPLLGSALGSVSSSGGKMMRPILLLLTARACGNISQETYAAAASLELLHTASLLHDDVVDESNMRRSAPSLNALYGNRVAILTGDYLFSLALNNAAKTKNIEIIEQLSQLGCALSGGEMMQLQAQNNGAYDEENYYNIIKGKTASLFASCAYIGALSAGVTQEVATRFRRFGEIVGLCFQIKDDIFDYYTSDIGKPTGSDMREGKITLPALYVLRTLQSPFTVAVSEKLASGKELDEKEIESLIELSKSAGGVVYAMAQIERLRAESLTLLPSDIPAGCHEALVAYIDYVIMREK